MTKVSIRQYLSDIVRARLETLSIANGFNFDFDTVQYWRGFPAEVSKNSITYRDTHCEFREENRRFQGHQHFEVEAAIFGNDIQTSKNQLQTDLIEVLRFGVSSIPNLPAHLVLLSTDPVCETSGKSQCVFRLMFKVVYYTKQNVDYVEVNP